MYLFDRSIVTRSRNICHKNADVNVRTLKKKKNAIQVTAERRGILNFVHVNVKMLENAHQNSTLTQTLAGLKESQKFNITNKLFHFLSSYFF